MTEASELPPLSVWLCSLLQTVESERFEYWLYYGYDAGDVWYDDSIKGPQFRAEVDRLIASAGLSDTVFAKQR